MHHCATEYLIIRKKLRCRSLDRLDFGQIRVLNGFKWILKQIYGLRRVQNLFLLEGYLYEEEGNQGMAVKSYLDMISFGFHISRGGLYVHLLIGIIKRQQAEIID